MSINKRRTSKTKRKGVIMMSAVEFNSALAISSNSQPAFQLKLEIQQHCLIFVSFLLNKRRDDSAAAIKDFVVF